MDLAAQLRQGLDHHRAGRVADAGGFYRRILDADPHHFDALHLLGVAEYQLGAPDAALEYIERALRIDTSVSAVFSNRGLVLAALHRYADAADSLTRAIALQPNDAEAHVYRGIALAMQGLADRAVDDFTRAIALDHKNVNAHVQRAKVLAGLKRHDEALASIDKAAALAPDSSDILQLRGSILRIHGRHEEAITALDRAITLDPLNAEFYNDRGILLHILARHGQALENFDRALGLRPDYREAFNNRAGVFLDSKRHAEAIATCDRAIALCGDYAPVHYTRAIALEGMGRWDEAIRSYDKVLACDPTMALVPGRRLYARMQVCQWAGLAEDVADLARRIEAGEIASPPFPVIATPLSAAQQRRAAELYVQNQILPLHAPMAHPPPLPGAKLRIAYISADFYNHATAHLIAAMIEMHDRSRFEIIGLSLLPLAADESGLRLKAGFDQLIDVSAQSEAEIAATARRLGIHIAVDLKGHTLDSRAGIFVNRAAPLQVAYLGYPGTMAMDCIDYVIADSTVIPPAHHIHYTEKVVCLPDSYQVNDGARPIADRIFTRTELELPDNGFVFCSFNNSYKITPDAFAIWMRLLARVDGSVLWLLESNSSAKANLQAAAQAHGVAPNRIVFAPRIGMADHLARHRAADLFLDSFHYNAHTSASDALWAGLPVVTRRGETFASRVAASLLTAAGLPDLITDTGTQYEDLALALATSPDKLSAVKTRLASRRLTCPLFDSRRFTRNIEAAYERMWDIYVLNEQPRAFNVAPDGEA